MWRFIVLLVTALVVADTTGLLVESDDAECCRDDHGGGGKQCPTTCPTCPCAWHTLKAAPVVEVQIARVVRAARAVEMPSPQAECGELAPAPITRPPIG